MSSNHMSSRPSITHAEIASFFQKILPPALASREVPFFFHAPRYPEYSPTRQGVSTVILSITPTSKFYRAASHSNDRQAPVCFLHRPWNLDRRSLRHVTLVLASHASFDEHLTVGWNVALADRLGLDVEDAVCIKGYKGNPDRKIGLVAKLRAPSSIESLVSSLSGEYQGVGDLHLPVTTCDSALAVTVKSSEIRYIAIMNAFHAEEIDRVLVAARERRWIGPDGDGSSILYLTGAARDYGIEAVRKVNMPAFCVGHRACEEWGIRYLGNELREAYPGLDVIEVLEEEEVGGKKTEKIEQVLKTKAKEKEAG